ncbi:MAG: hypothetical protein HQL02_03835 [Nitrospirae bacterium]|nr:hypothetical protein [Nitrospirota bacterium]
MEALSEVSTVVLSDLGDVIPSISIDSQDMPEGDNSEQSGADQVDNEGSATSNDELANELDDELDNEFANDPQIDAFRRDNPLLYDVIKRMLTVILDRSEVDEPQEDIPVQPQAVAPSQAQVLTPTQTQAVVPTQAATSPQTQVATSTQTTPAAEMGRGGIERFIAPPRSTSNANTTPESFTNQQIEQFYRALASGRYRGRENDARDIELRIARAINEGRVTN